MGDIIVHEFVKADKADELAEAEIERVYQDEVPYSANAELLRPLSGLASQGDGQSRVRLPKAVNRERITTAFQDAFELIGGVPRLAHWADEHPSDFYKLYARLLPTSAQQSIEHSGEVLIRHALPPGALDV